MGTIITLVGLAVTILGNIYWIPTFGYMACAWAFLLSSVIMTLMCYVGGQIYDPTPYRWKEALIYISLGALAIYSGNYLGQTPIPMFFTQNAGLLVILAFLLGKEFQWKGWKPQIKNR